MRLSFFAALLFSATVVAQSPAVPVPFNPFPAGLNGTLVFHSDRRGADNPDGRNHIFTLDLAGGRVTQLTSGRQSSRSASALVAGWTPHFVRVVPRRELRFVRHGRRRHERDAAHRPSGQ